MTDKHSLYLTTYFGLYVYIPNQITIMMRAVNDILVFIGFVLVLINE